MLLRLIFTFTALCLFALLLQIYPFPPAFALLNPPWLCIFILYFALYTNLEVGIVGGAIIGLCADILTGSTWGAHSVTLTIVMYLFSFFCDRIRHHPLWQQAMWAGMFTHIYLLVFNWIEGLAGYNVDYSTIIIKTCMSILIWPGLFVIFNKFLRQHRLEYL